MSAVNEVFEDKDAPTTAIAVRDQVRSLQVFDQASLTYANGWLLRVKELRRWCDDKFDEGIKKAFSLHRQLVAQKREWTDQLDEAEKVLKPKIAAYLEEQDRIRFEAERAAQRAKEAVEKEANDASDVAHELIQKGELDEANEVVEMTATKIEEIEAAVPVVPEKAVAEGTTLRETWDFEITNESIIPRTFMMPNVKKIRAYAAAMKQQGEIPGVRIFARKTVSTRIRI